ncbi:DUF6332 family protein [Streptomyces fulvorobeus]|uniref:Uncharacterized protein n=1 Tax=Streptomyces fulvorobeus TaxID=284028 RepID=A0A7J0C1Q7_9ACTN|nr:DUF6332 family protein [Streptomyces fulvorobeus]NYE39446.1 hypothetical protein [Streptomyces fulvorobeus]GFM95676.1 hypothetical protein Sfulv_04870 [Streptomyces fulvorobeus]
MGRRSQEERDAITVETGYALVSACFVAAAGFLGVVSPALVLDLPVAVERVLGMIGGAVAALAFTARLVHVLWRFPNRSGARELPSEPSPRPGRPGPGP